MKIYKIVPGTTLIGIDEKGIPFYLKKELVELEPGDWHLVDSIEPLPEKKDKND